MGKYEHLWSMLEEDLPAPYFAAFMDNINLIPDEEPVKAYLQGLSALHANQHIQAIDSFRDLACQEPSFINPKLYHVLASLEANIMRGTLDGYYREFFIYQLNFVQSPQIESFVMAYQGLQNIWNKQKLTGIEQCKKAEVLGGNFYPTLYLIARAYSNIGDYKSFNIHFERLVQLCPRIAKIKRETFIGSLL